VLACVYKFNTVYRLESSLQAREIITHAKSLTK
jgi:hypothetical protein